MTILKTAIKVTLFVVGVGVSGNWKETVLRPWEINCTLLPDPPPYPRALLRLADGHVTVKGVKELVACEYERTPGLMFEVR